MTSANPTVHDGETSFSRGKPLRGVEAMDGKRARGRSISISSEKCGKTEIHVAKRWICQKEKKPLANP